MDETKGVNQSSGEEAKSGREENIMSEGFESDVSHLEHKPSIDYTNIAEKLNQMEREDRSGFFGDAILTNPESLRHMHEIIIQLQEMDRETYDKISFEAGKEILGLTKDVKETIFNQDGLKRWSKEPEYLQNQGWYEWDEYRNNRTLHTYDLIDRVAGIMDTHRPQQGSEQDWKPEIQIVAFGTRGQQMDYYPTNLYCKLNDGTTHIVPISERIWRYINNQLSDTTKKLLELAEMKYLVDMISSNHKAYMRTKDRPLNEGYRSAGNIGYDHYMEKVFQALGISLDNPGLLPPKE